MPTTSVPSLHQDDAPPAHQHRQRETPTEPALDEPSCATEPALEEHLDFGDPLDAEQEQRWLLEERNETDAQANARFRHPNYFHTLFPGRPGHPVNKWHQNFDLEENNDAPPGRA